MKNRLAFIELLTQMDIITIETKIETDDKIANKKVCINFRKQRLKKIIKKQNTS